MHDATAGNDGAGANNGIERDAHTRGIRKNEFRGRILLLPGVQRPAFVVEVENRRNGNQIHVGFVIGLDGADIAPVRFFFFIFIAEVVGEDAMLFDDARDDVLAEIVLGIGVFGVGDQDGHQELRVKEIDAHGSVHLVGVHARGLGMRGLFLESDNAPVFVRFDDTETARGLLGIHFEGRDGNIRAGFHVLLQHLLVIHFVDMVAGKNEDVVRLLGTDRINVLIDRVGGALVPLLRDAHLRSEDFDEFAVAHERGPAAANVAIQAERFVLRENKNAAEVAIETIREGDVNDAVNSAERHCRLGAITRQGPKALALSAGQQHTDRVAHQRHVPSPENPAARRSDILAANRGCTA